MRGLRAWLLRLAASVAPGRRDRDFDAELESHLQLHIDDNVRAGMTPDDARRSARLALGGVAQTRERQRDRRALPALDALRQDVTYAWRVLRKSPTFTATAIVTLALGIGANSAIFSVVNAVLLRPLPFARPDRLVQIFATDVVRNDRYDTMSYPTFIEWADENRSFESMAAFANRGMTIGLGDSTVMAGVKRVTPGFFTVLGVQPALGRAFRADEQADGANRIVILSDGFWRRHLGGRTDVLDETLRIDDVLYTIVGIMPATFHVEQSADEQLYLPLAVDPNRGHGFLRVLGRLRPDVTLAQARADIAQIAARQNARFPRAYAGTGVNLLWMADGLARDARFGLYVMLSVVGVVLLIACANVAGLMLARGSSRQRELAVRAALGAGRGRLARQLLTESLMIAAAGGILGLLTADWTSRGLASILARQFNVARVDATSIDASVVVFTAAVSLLTGLLFGVIPAFTSASPDLNDALRESGRTATSLRTPRLGRSLVVIETALAMILLAGAGTLLRTFVTLRSTDPGFRTGQALAVNLFLPQPRFAERAERITYFDSALERVRALPGVEGAAFVADLPLNGSTDGRGFHIPGRPDPAPDKPFSSGFNVATPGYFSTMGIPVVEGREFLDSDRANGTPVIVINETAARRFWPGESPLGHQIDLPNGAETADLPYGEETTRLTIVGVTRDVRHVSLGVPPRAEVFLDSLQSPLPWPWLVLVVRGHGDAAALADPVQAALREVNPSVAIQRTNTVDNIVALSIARPRIYSALLGTFAALSLVLAAVGLYGLIAYAVSQREHEIGVRVALGAARGDILRLVLGEGLRLAVIGAAVGLLGAFATTRLLVGLMNGVHPNDPIAFGVVTLILLLASLVACYLPARRASRVDPMIALRAE